MYAVLKSVGKQFKVSPGDTLKMDKIEGNVGDLSLIHISEPTRRTPISYAVFCL